MPMRDEIVVPVRRSEMNKGLSESSLLPVLCFCLVGLLLTLYFVLSKLPFDQLSLLIAQYDLFG